MTLFEADTRAGGHTRIFAVEEQQGPVRTGAGFMVFNRQNRPMLTGLFDYLGVASYPTDMSFSASFDHGALEYAGTDLDTLFGQRRNLLNPRFWSVLSAILRFNQVVLRALRDPSASGLPLGGFLDLNGFDEKFRPYYLCPMAAAIWSCPRGQVALFPAINFFCAFSSNHGLIKSAHRSVEPGDRYLTCILHQYPG